MLISPCHERPLGFELVRLGSRDPHQALSFLRLEAFPDSHPLAGVLSYMESAGTGGCPQAASGGGSDLVPVSTCSGSCKEVGELRPRTYWERAGALLQVHALLLKLLLVNFGTECWGTLGDDVIEQGRRDGESLGCGRSGEGRKASSSQTEE